MRKISLILLSLMVLISCETGVEKPATKHPNILIIFADDLGYGDVACYNSDSKVKTPHLDKLAAEGMKFTDAHSPSTICTPSRYSLLTGRYAFRLNYKGVFTGVGGPCLIKDERLTLPEMLKTKGYSTALMGKWHVGMTFYDKEGKPLNQNGLGPVKRIDYSRPATGGPIDHGFDEFFGTVSCPTTDWLYAYIDGNKIPVPPTKILDKTNLPKHPYARDNRTGMHAPNFDLEEVDIVFLKKSQEFLKKHVKNNPGKPFFLLHSTQAVHLPSFPGKAFKGKTNAGPHGDFIFELDYVVGELMKTLKELGVDDNTIVMFSSDNGPEVRTSIHMREDHKHDGARPWRGVKRDNWEGGHRVPFIVRWPGKVKSNSQYDYHVNLTDVMATCASIVNYKLPREAGEDSFNLVPAFTKPSTKIRDHNIHATGWNALAIREGRWKYLDHTGSGGNDYSKEKLIPLRMKGVVKVEAPGQLYDMEADPSEKNNLYHQHPDVVKKMKAKLDKFVKSGRSAP